MDPVQTFGVLLIVIAFGIFLATHEDDDFNDGASA